MAGALFATNAFALEYAQTARAYAMAIFFVLLATIALVHAIRSRRRAWWIAYAVAATLMVLTHLASLLVVMAHAAAFMATRPSSTQTVWRRARGPLLVTTLAVLLVLTFRAFVRGLEASLSDIGLVLQGLTWIPPLRLRTPLDVAGDFSGSRSLIVVVFGLAVFGVWHGWRSRDPWHRRMTAVTAIWFLFPIFALATLSLLVPLFVSRYLIPCLPALLLLAALGITSIRPRWAMALIVIGFLALNLRADARWYDLGTNDDYRAAVNLIVDNGRPEDQLELQPLIHAPYDYYTRRLGLDPASLPAQVQPANLETTRRVWVLLHTPDLATGRAESSELDRLRHASQKETVYHFLYVDVLRFDLG